jgi:hypothetical protein
MKRQILLLLSLASLLILALAPAYGETQNSVGFKGGLNIASFTGPDNEGTESRNSFIGGGFFTFMFSEMWGLQPEALYTSKGADIPMGAGIKAALKLTYLEIPVLLKFVIPTSSNVSPSLFVGPSIGFNLNAKITGQADPASIDIEVANAKSTEFALVFGGSLDIALEKTVLLLDVRYSLGLSKPFEDTTTWDLDDPPLPFPISDPTDGRAPDIKNGVISIMAGFGFQLGG